MNAVESGASPVFGLLSWIVTLLVPVALVMTAVRLLMTPAFLEIEYRTPNFPPDPYGFTQEDRLYWSKIALEHLLDDDSIASFASLRLPDGSPVFNQREVGHMADAIRVIQAALRAWYVSLAGLLLLGVWAWFGGWFGAYREGLARGGWLTVIFVGVVVFFVLVGFTVFFVFFHEVFFDPGTWTFLFSDTFIRLFPERFWRDAFLAIGLLSIAGGWALAQLARVKR